MKIEANYKQPITIETDRDEAKTLALELRDMDLAGRPKTRELCEALIEAERQFREREYRGPG